MAAVMFQLELRSQEADEHKFLKKTIEFQKWLFIQPSNTRWTPKKSLPLKCQPERESIPVFTFLFRCGQHGRTTKISAQNELVRFSCSIYQQPSRTRLPPGRQMKGVGIIWIVFSLLGKNESKSRHHNAFLSMIKSPKKATQSFPGRPPAAEQ